MKGINLRAMEEHEEDAPRKEKPQIAVQFPEKPSVLANAPLHEIGKVIFVVGELLIV